MFKGQQTLPTEVIRYLSLDCAPLIVIRSGVVCRCLHEIDVVPSVQFYHNIPCSELSAHATIRRLESMETCVAFSDRISANSDTCRSNGQGIICTAALHCLNTSGFGYVPIDDSLMKAYKPVSAGHLGVQAHHW